MTSRENDLLMRLLIQSRFDSWLQNSKSELNIVMIQPQRSIGLSNADMKDGSLFKV